MHLDPCADGVIVPSKFLKQRQMVLQIGYDMPVEIPDLVVDDRGWSGTLSFRGTPFHVTVPWTAVFAIVGEDGRGKIYSEDVPPTLVDEIARLNATSSPLPRSKKEIARETVVSLSEYRGARG